MRFSGMRSGGGREAVEDEQQAFYLTVRTMGKDLGNITTEAMSAYTVLCRNCSLLDSALNLGLGGDTGTLWSNDCHIN